jgi:soluble lytic murein transglycosylase-like protein
MVVTESAFDSKAVSHKGAVGLMQIMPATARRYGVHPEPGSPVSVKLTDPEVNIQTGTRYLADLLRLFGGQTELAVAAYNAGENAVVRAGNRIPEFKETQSYVKKVMSVYRLLQTRS